MMTTAGKGPPPSGRKRYPVTALSVASGLPSAMSGMLTVSKPRSSSAGRAALLLAPARTIAAMTIRSGKALAMPCFYATPA